MKTLPWQRPPTEAIATVRTIMLLLADVGLTLATTTDRKNVIYSLGTQYTDAQRDLHWIPSSCRWYTYRQ
jgi:hypothetical protein